MNVLKVLWASLSKDFWVGAAILVVLMSGIAAIIREGLIVFFPAIASSTVLFAASFKICFFLSGMFVVLRQRMSIVSLEATIQQAKDNSDESGKIQNAFASLMQEGKSLNDELQATSDFISWGGKRANWIDKVSQYLIEHNWHTDAEAFKHSGEARPRIGGTTNDGYYRQSHGEQLTKFRDELKAIAQRKSS